MDAGVAVVWLAAATALTAFGDMVLAETGRAAAPVTARAAAATRSARTACLSEGVCTGTHSRWLVLSEVL